MIWLWGWHVFESIISHKKRNIYQIQVASKFYKKITEDLKKNNLYFKLLESKDIDNRKLNSNKSSIEITIQDDKIMDRLYGKNHQGIAICVDQIQFWTLKDWVQSQKDKSVLVACDLLEDPQNLGAIIRTSKALGASGLLVTDKKCAKFNGALAKAAAGALEILPIIKVVNLSQSLMFLKDFGYRIYGLDHRGSSKFTKSDRSVIVLGQEGNGMRELTKKRCDDIISIHTESDFAVLNVSVSAGIILYEFLRKD